MRSSLSQAAGWLATVAISAGAVGIGRSLVRFFAGALPDQYLVHGAVANGALYFAIGAVMTPLVMALGRRYRQDRAKRRDFETKALLLGGLALVFWAFNTAIGFRVLRELFRGESKTVFDESILWVPGMSSVVILGLWSVARSRFFETSRRHTRVSILLVVAGVALMLYSNAKDPSSSGSLELRPSASRHNPIILILVDTLRADHLSCYGYNRPTSPHLDALALESVLYSRTFAPAPWTRPSCGSLLSSLYPPETGLDGLFSALPEEVPILPQFLRREGYRTAAIAANVQVSAQFGFAKGFDSHDIGTTYLQWTGVKMALSRLGLVPFDDIYPRYDAGELTDRALDWLDRHGVEEPFFLYLHYADPHAPYRPPADADRWREFAPPAALGVAEPPPTPTWFGRPLTPAEVQAMVARYDAEIAFFDAEVARLFEYLEERDAWRETLIIVTADHGEEFLDHGGWTHASSLYNEQIHVPLIIKYPESMAAGSGKRVDHEASLVDIVPTIQEVLGAAWPDSSFRGRSLLRDDLGEDGYAVYSRAYDQRLRALIQGGAKIIQRVGATRRRVEEEMVYSLSGDFGEEGDGKDHGSLEPDRLAAMRALLESIDSEDAVGREEITLDPETLRELEALGYLN